MSTYTQILYHIIFSTKKREKTLLTTGRKQLFKYIWGVLKNNDCHLYRINGVEDHIRILTHIHPTVALSSLIKDIKLASSDFIKKEALFSKFGGWQDGYGAFTHCIKDKERLINYVKNQEVHHKNITFIDEYIELLNEHEIEFDAKYLL